MALSFSILHNRSFRNLLLTRGMGTMAMQAQAVIVGWQVYSLTKNVFLLGLVGLVEAVPAILSALIAGHIVDTYSAIRMYKLCLWFLALNTLFLLLCGGSYLPLSNHNILIALFIGVFISGIARSFIRPASSSLLQQVAGRPNVPAGTAWITSMVQIATISGPALAGLIYGGYSAHGAWLFPAFLTVFSAISALFITVTNPDQPIAKKDRAWDSIKTGCSFIFNHKILLPVMALDMTAVLFGGATAMLPAYADQVLHVGSEGLGALRAAPAIGAVTVALFLAVKPFRYLSTRLLMWAIAGFGLSIIGFGLSKTFWLSIIFLILSGALDSINVVIRQTLFQFLTPNQMMGRVSSVNGMFITSSNEIGAFESGTAARLLGLVPSVVFGGVATIVIVAATALFAPKMRHTIVDTHDMSEKAS